MLIEADTRHGNFQENKTLIADSTEEFIVACRDNVGYISSATDPERLRRIWFELIFTGKSDYGWTNFSVKD